MGKRATVIAFPAADLARKPDLIPNPTVIQAAEHILARARNGSLTGLAYIAHLDDGDAHGYVGTAAARPTETARLLQYLACDLVRTPT